MRHIKSREKFLNKNTINESVTNEIRFGGSYLGRLINSTWRLLGSATNRLRINSLPAQLKSELELLVAQVRLKKDAEDLELFQSIGDEKFFEEVKKSCKELDGNESESDKQDGIQKLIHSCNQKKESLKDDQKDFKESIDDFVKGLQDELNKMGGESKNKAQQESDQKNSGMGQSNDILSQNLNSLFRIITKVNNLDTDDKTSLAKKESRIFEFAPPSEPKESGVGELNEIKKKIKLGIVKLSSNEGGIAVSDVVVKDILSNLKIKENRKVVINLYKQISDIMKTGNPQKSPLMLNENFILSDVNKSKMIATKIAEFIKLLISFKKFYKDLLDIGQDIQTFIFSFEKIVSQLNKVKPKSNKSTLYDILGVNVNATTDEIKKAYRKKSMTMHPDKGGDEEKFKQLAGAYEILSNEEKREKYNKENNI